MLGPTQVGHKRTAYFVCHKPSNVLLKKKLLLLFYLEEGSTWESFLRS